MWFVDVDGLGRRMREPVFGMALELHERERWVLHESTKVPV